jgi:hypothetical protein
MYRRHFVVELGKLNPSFIPLLVQENGKSS